jgi:hypothetical protein
VFGDIGTSPLYALKECLSGPHGFGAAPETVLGVLSLIFWAITLVVTVKYLGFIMRADNRGEGASSRCSRWCPRRSGTRAGGRSAGWRSSRCWAPRCSTAMVSSPRPSRC